MLLDYQNHLWGKWHPSAEAKRLGPMAVRLERLRYRDQLSFEEACREILGKTRDLPGEPGGFRGQDAAADSRGDLVGEEQLEAEADREMRPDETAGGEGAGGISRRVLGTVLLCINASIPRPGPPSGCGPELSVAEIARLREVDQKPLYRRLDKIYRSFEKDLDGTGSGGRTLKRSWKAAARVPGFLGALGGETE